MPDETRQDANLEAGQVQVKKKGKFKFILIAILLVLGLGIGGTYYFYGDKIIRMVTGKGPAPKTAEKSEKKKHTPGPIMALEPFIFNLAGNPSKFAKISLGLEVKNIKIEEEVKKAMPAIRDKVLLVLGTKPTEAFLDVNQRNKIKEELYEGLKGLFKDGEDLKAVYVTDIIIQ